MRLQFFISSIIVLYLLELLLPKRKSPPAKSWRQISNVLMMGLGALLVRVVLPVGAVFVAQFALENEWGLLNQFSLPVWLNLVISLTLLDLAIYGQHVMFHKIPVFWRLHRVHHSDTHMDVTTGIRFHPIEILASLLIKFAAIIIIGVSPEAMLVFAIVLNVMAMFSHSNLNLSSSVDKWLRYFIVTPDMHRVHHSVHPFETNSNYGFNIPWWDKLFGTYNEQPIDGHLEMQIGIEKYRAIDDNRLDKLLLQPMRA
ncbi:MAG: sterol desaturase family protein [Arenicellales bacterium WSBS_2016_MAG_OTU3]